MTKGEKRIIKMVHDRLVEVSGNRRYSEKLRCRAEDQAAILRWILYKFRTDKSHKK